MFLDVPRGGCGSLKFLIRSVFMLDAPISLLVYLLLLNGLGGFANLLSTNWHVSLTTAVKMLISAICLISLAIS